MGTLGPNELLGFYVVFWLLGATIIWVFSIWASIGVARNKGRNPVLGGVLGAVFSLLGLVLIWLTPANIEAVMRREMELRARLGQARPSQDVP